ncbi:hypothetical protein EMPS_03550 [Entomortierella parvispora]|uniref:Disease resistance R13L4/SHOC-2-like LRR domain-containing protein n=1 Tax=Entomortierella parvispora TaxID=205924 RepID=A0A9P3LUZ8_9FUNG|nr:hypothetical protein EMPS_03550 [Entomortierella parvispora]
MGATVSRDHAKLPFGYTHARKDHACSTSTTASGSRRRLASRLLRTSDTTSVTPFPIQDGSASVASIPEMVLVLPPSIQQQQQQTGGAEAGPQQQQQQQQQQLHAQTHYALPPPLPQATIVKQAQTMTQNSEMVPYSGTGAAAVAANPSPASRNPSDNSCPGASGASSSSPALLPIQHTPTNADVFSRSQSDSQGCCSCSSCCCSGDSASLTALDHASALCHHNYRSVNKNIAAGTIEPPVGEQQQEHQVTENTTAPGSTTCSTPTSSAAASTPSTTEPLAVDLGSCSAVALTSSNLHHAHTSSYSIAASTCSESHGYNSVNASRGNSSATTATMATTFSFASLSSSSLSPSSRYDPEPFSSIHQKSKKSPLAPSRSQHQLHRTQEEMDNDMDIISALGIADLPYGRGMHDYFTIGNGSSILARSSPASSPPAALPYPHLPHHASHHHVSTMKLDSTLRVPEHQEDSETQVTTAIVPKRALTYELGTHHSSHRNDYDYGLDEDEDEDDMDEGDMGAQQRKKPSPPSILDEDMEPLSPFPFSDLPSLTNIGLCTRGIVKLSSNIKLLSSATCVQICCNDLVQIPVEIGFLRNLTLLDLSKNKLTSLPESIINLAKLVDLKLSNNELVSLPDGIGGLTKLAVLAVDSNRLESLPSQIGNLKGLVHLDLSNNPLTVLPAEVGKLQYLRRLFLDRCPLVEEFVHSPLHSPPTLLELAARVLVRHDLNVPAIVPQHLKTYIKSARRCTFCDGPYFDSWVKRGKMIDKNDMFIPLEYTLCQPHWNTELERVKLLFCKRPITSPSPWIPPPPPQSSTRTLGSGKNNTHPPALTTSSGPLSSSSPPSSNATSNINNSSNITTVNATPRPNRGSRKNTVDSNGEQQSSPRNRPLSVIGNRLSMLLRRQSSRSESRSPSTPPTRERTQSALLRSPNRASWIPSFSSASQENSEDVATGTTATSRPNSRPAGISVRNATSQLLERTGLRTRNNRPLSLGSAMMESSPAILTSAAYSSPLSTTVPITAGSVALHPTLPSASPSSSPADAI